MIKRNVLVCNITTVVKVTQYCNTQLEILDSGQADGFNNN